MKKLAMFVLLIFVIFTSVFAQESKENKDSIEVKNLKGKIIQGLDSIMSNDIYTLDGRGYKYYRFSRGVFVSRSGQINGEFVARLDSINVGEFGSLNRISFRYHNGEILFNYFDYEGEQCAEKTMEQLFSAIRKYW